MNDEIASKVKRRISGIKSTWSVYLKPIRSGGQYFRSKFTFAIMRDSESFTRKHSKFNRLTDGQLSGADELMSVVLVS